MPKGKYIRTKEIKEKQSKVMTGKKRGNCWNKGKKMWEGKIHPMKDRLVSRKTRDKISQSKIGIPSSRKGTICSKETIEKMRKSHIGIPSPRKGVKVSNETKEKMSKAHLGKNNHMYERRGEKSPMYGRRGKDCPAFGKIRNKNLGYGIRSYYKSSLQGQVCFRSTYELSYAQYLDQNNILWMYEMETFDLGDTTYTPDFYLPREEKFIEIKGYIKPESQEKINKFLEQYPWDLKILYGKDLRELGCKI